MGNPGIGEAWVEAGQMIQCDKDFDGVVHLGCHASEVVVRAAEATAAALTRTRQQPLRRDCHLEHAVEYF